jgi:hypothetical protein
MDPKDQNNHGNEPAKFIKEVVTEHVIPHGIGHALAGHIGGFFSGLLHTAPVNEGENEWVMQQALKNGEITFTAPDNDTPKPGK